MGKKFKPPIRSSSIMKHSFRFSLKAIQLAGILKSQKGYFVADQMLKLGTSIGATYYESRNAESMQEFMYKVNVTEKMVTEVSHWLSKAKDPCLFY